MKKITILLLISYQFASAQVKISSQGNLAPINPNAWLELANNGSGAYGSSGTYKGFLLPKVDFTNSVFTNNSVWGINGNTPVEGLMVYNIGNTVSNGFYGPGVYYWDATNHWIFVKYQPLPVQNEWSLNGNAGTTATNFIGTTDAKDVIFKSNNTERVRITSAGNVGIGNVSGSLNTLQVNGSVGGAYKSVATTAYTMLSTDFVVSWNGSANGTINLPPADPNFKGRIYFIKNTSNNLLTILPNGSETIDGNASLIVKPNYHVTLIATGATSGTTWEVLTYNNTTTSKEYLQVTRSGTEQILSHDGEVILFNNIHAASGITYNTSTGVATLTPGKIYKITLGIHAVFNGNADNFWFLLYGGSSLNIQLSPSAAEVLPASFAFPYASNGVLEIIFTPNTTNYTIAAKILHFTNSGRVRYDVYSGMTITEL